MTSRHSTENASQTSDTTDEHAKRELRRYIQIIESSRDALISLSKEGVVTSWNTSAQTLYGYTSAEILGESVHVIAASDRKDELPAILSGLGREHSVLQCDTIHVRKDGTPVDVSVIASVIGADDGRVDGYILVIRNIAELKTYEEQLRQQTLHDALTGLPNRILFEDRVEQRLLAIDVERETMAVLVIDLDRFRDVNDARGHAFGDEVLQSVAARLKGGLKESESVARLGGNTFAVLLPSAGNVMAIDVAGALLSALEGPLRVGDTPVYIAAGIGIAVYPVHGSDVSTLLRKAHAAMYTAKRDGTGYAFYADEIDPNSADRLALMAELRYAIKNEQLVLQYQPQVRLLDGRAERVEALVRWDHPTRGILKPDEFVELAERAGLIRYVTQWVLNEAIRQASKWVQSGHSVNVAINLSASNLHDRDLVDLIVSYLSLWKIDASNITLEITESALVIDPARALMTLSMLHGMGIQISIDDFGTGYSSLAYLQGLPIDQIKIDRSFVGGMLGFADGDSSIIVQSIIDLGHNLDLEVVGEGVETQQQLDVLLSLGCDMVQGYCMSHPLSPAEYEKWLASHDRERWSRSTSLRGTGLRLQEA